MLQGSPTKLKKSGEWGIRVVVEVGTPPPSRGAEVMVRSRGGKEWADTIGKVVWSGETDEGELIYLCTSAKEEEKKGEASESANLPPNWQELFRQLADHMDDGNLTAFAQVLRHIADGPPEEVLQSQDRPKSPPVTPQPPPPDPTDDPDEMPF